MMKTHNTKLAGERTRLRPVKYTLPIYWASYLINDDASGITEEDRKQADLFIDKNELPSPCGVSEETHFSKYNDANTGLGGEVAEYTFLIAD